MFGHVVGQVPSYERFFGNQECNHDLDGSFVKLGASIPRSNVEGVTHCLIWIKIWKPAHRGAMIAQQTLYDLGRRVEMLEAALAEEKKAKAKLTEEMQKPSEEAKKLAYERFLVRSEMKKAARQEPKVQAKEVRKVHAEDTRRVQAEEVWRVRVQSEKARRAQAKEARKVQAEDTQRVQAKEGQRVQAKEATQRVRAEEARRVQEESRRMQAKEAQRVQAAHAEEARRVQAEEARGSG